MHMARAPTHPLVLIWSASMPPTAIGLLGVCRELLAFPGHPRETCESAKGDCQGALLCCSPTNARPRGCATGSSCSLAIGGAQGDREGNVCHARRELHVEPAHDAVWYAAPTAPNDFFFPVSKKRPGAGCLVARWPQRRVAASDRAPSRCLSKSVSQVSCARPRTTT